MRASEPGSYAHRAPYTYGVGVHVWSLFDNNFQPFVPIANIYRWKIRAQLGQDRVDPRIVPVSLSLPIPTDCILWDLLHPKRQLEPLLLVLREFAQGLAVHLHESHNCRRPLGFLFRLVFLWVLSILLAVPEFLPGFVVADSQLLIELSLLLLLGIQPVLR